MASFVHILMVVRNGLAREVLFCEVLTSAAKAAQHFTLVNHASTDATSEYFTKTLQALGCEVEVFDEADTLNVTMDTLKGKYTRLLAERYANDPNAFLLLLDADEIITPELASELKQLSTDIECYQINRHTRLLTGAIDRNAFLPLCFRPNAVEVGPFARFHDLYRIRTERVAKLKGILRHESWPSMDALAKKMLFYARGEAEALFEENPARSSINIGVRMFYDSALYFGYTLLLQKNFFHLDGWLYSMHWVAYHTFKWIFYRELQTQAKNHIPSSL